MWVHCFEYNTQDEARHGRSGWLGPCCTECKDRWGGHCLVAYEKGQYYRVLNGRQKGTGEALWAQLRLTLSSLAIVVVHILYTWVHEVGGACICKSAYAHSIVYFLRIAHFINIPKHDRATNIYLIIYIYTRSFPHT